MIGTDEARNNPVHGSDGADRGNQPIDRRVDTISKQYQAVRRPQGGKYPYGSSYGGGAPWES